MACANPLLLEWVEEWLETARERNSKGVTVYKKAYQSLKACPLPFQHPSEAKQLEGFGDKLCQRLTDKMREHCEANGLPMPEQRRKGRKKSAEDGENGNPDEPAPKKARKTKPYVPALHSGAYGLIMALSTLEVDAPGIMKEEVIRLAEPHCKASFTAPSSANGFYTAWNSMKTLTEKELIHERGRPKRYSLLPEGWEVARRIREAQGESSDLINPPSRRRLESVASIDNSPVRSSTSRNTGHHSQQSHEADLVDIPQGEVITSESSLPSFTPITLRPGDFTVQLVLDNREVRAKQDRDYIQNNLSNKGVAPIVRSLPVGDVLWIAKIHDPIIKDQLNSDEILLDWVVERKRLDDLISSIKDGRYNDQKFRLQKSGIKNVIYIIEAFAMNADHYQKYDEAVQSSIASMQVVNGYFVKQTLKMDDTIRYLVGLTKMLKQKYEGKPLKVIPTKVITAQNYLPLLDHLAKKEPSSEYHVTYLTLASLSSKSDSLTLRDVFLKMLMCTRGVTGEKAIEIQKRWKTPHEFIDAYKNCEVGRTADEARKRRWEMVSNEMGDLIGRKKVAKTLSGKISEVWGDVS